MSESYDHLRAQKDAIVERENNALRHEGATMFVCGGTGKLSPEAQAELDDFARWMYLPKPRPEFRAWRKSASASLSGKEKE